MGQITLEQYKDDNIYLCIRMRFNHPETGKAVITTFTNQGFQEGLEPAGTMLWLTDHQEQAMFAYELVCKRVMELDEGKS